MNRHIAFGLPIGVALIEWSYLGKPLQAAGALLFIAAAAAIWPALLCVLVLGVPYLLALAVPRGLRAWWRTGAPRSAQRSARIPKAWRRAIIFADRKRCVYCHARGRLQIDHSYPWSHGGLTALPNLFALCVEHNQVKSDKYGSVGLVGEIIAAERRARRSYMRWLRLAWGLA